MNSEGLEQSIVEELYDVICMCVIIHLLLQYTRDKQCFMVKSSRGMIFPMLASVCNNKMTTITNLSVSHK